MFLGKESAQGTLAYQPSATNMNWLQGLRGLAAVKILLFHSYGDVKSRTGEAVMPYLHAGYYTVPFFFILSGYVMAHALVRLHSAAITNRLSVYVIGRLLRVYLPYWPATLLMLFAYHYLGTAWGATNQPGVFNSLALYPTNQTLALTVAWTLQHELFFYGVCAVYFIHPRLFFGLLVVWALWLGGNWSAAIEWPNHPLLRLISSPVNAYFFVGLALYALQQRRLWPAHMNPYGASALFALFLALSTSIQGHPVLEAVILFGLVGFIARWQCPLPPFFLGLGLASYSIYLVHVPIQSLTMRLGLQWGIDDAKTLFWGSSLISLAGGLIYYRIVEARVIQLTQRVLSQVKKKAPFGA